MPTAHDIETPARGLSPRRRDAFRAAWFHQLGAADPRIVRLGVTASEAIEQMLDAAGPRAASSLRFSRLDLPGLAIASAASAGSAEAWRLVEAHAPLLSRALLGFESIQHPAVAARRFLDGVRDATLRQQPRPENLRRYAGTQPLRLWLVDRLFSACSSGVRGPSDLASRADLRRAVGLLDSQRDRVRAVVGIESEPRVRRLLDEDD